MPIALPRTLRATLTTRIAAGLRASSIVSGASLSIETDFFSLHKLVSVGSPTDQQLRRYIGDLHVSDFVVNEVHQRHIGPWRFDQPPTDFCDVLGADAPAEWAEELIRSLEALPWQYTAYVRIPGEIDPVLVGENGLELTSKVALVPSNLVPRAPVNEGVASLATALLGRSYSGSVDEPALYLRMAVEGYVPQRRDSLGANQVIASVLSMYGIGLSLGIFSHDPWRFTTKRPPSYSVEMYRTDSSEEQHSWSIAFDPAQEKEMGKIIHRLAPTPGETAVRTLALLGTLGKVMDRADERLRNAARWYFDSHCGSNDQVRFVQVCIALEILLGDEKQGRETGLSQLMANRCAYLLGRNSRDRENITSGFKKGYDIRSRIVHAGKSLLSTEEKAHFSYMQKLCSSVIQKECRELEQ
ncbi:hypothetical protein [Stenotrophomonas sp. AR026]|uniref:hypothetical protein n=1 Tax=Stenotrophomonas sp. AR026 TaxID=3398462 RepID=UPI003BB15919